MAKRTHHPCVKVLDASDVEKDRCAYELAMFLYDIYRDKQNHGMMREDKTDVDNKTQ